MLMLDRDPWVGLANEGLCARLQVPASDAEGGPVYELGERQWDMPEPRRLLEYIVIHKGLIEDFEVTRKFAHLDQRALRLNSRCLIGEDREGRLILPAFEDVTAPARVFGKPMKRCRRAAKTPQIGSGKVASTDDWTETP